MLSRGGAVTISDIYDFHLSVELILRLRALYKRYKQRFAIIQSGKCSPSNPFLRSRTVKRYVIFNKQLVSVCRVATLLNLSAYNLGGN